MHQNGLMIYYYMVKKSKMDLTEEMIKLGNKMNEDKIEIAWNKFMDAIAERYNLRKDGEQLVDKKEVDKFINYCNEVHKLDNKEESSYVKYWKEKNKIHPKCNSGDI